MNHERPTKGRAKAKGAGKAPKAKGEVAGAADGGANGGARGEIDGGTRGDAKGGIDGGAKAVDTPLTESSPRGMVDPTGGAESTTESADATTARGVTTSAPSTARERLKVRKTYKLYIGGKFPRSESGRSWPVLGADGGVLANASRASRKDVRDAVVAARAAFPSWSGATAYNRGQVIYRAAEMLEGRAEQLAAEVAAAEGVTAAAAAATVAKAVDRLVWYAGWTDKLAQVFGAPNPVAGPFLNVSEPEPTGVVGLVAPVDASLLGLVSRLAPILAGGNTAVVLASERHPLPAITFAEVLATSDLPAGAANILTGATAELVGVLAAHMDVNALDLAGLDPALWREVELAAAANVKRVVPPVALRGDDWLDDDRAQDAYWVAAFLETKTVWHPAGL